MSKKATEMLKADHEKVEELLDRLVDQRGDPQTVLADIEREVKVHAHIEETIFYPAYRESVGKEEAQVLVEESLEEHDLVEKILHDMSGLDPGEAAFRGKASVLKEAIMHHADDEEEEMFPKAENVMGDKKLKELGARLAEEKKAYEPELEIASG